MSSTSRDPSSSRHMSLAVLFSTNAVWRFGMEQRECAVDVQLTDPGPRLQPAAIARAYRRSGR